MAKYQKYAEYKDSGIEWLGEIPSHWYGKKLKYLLMDLVRGPFGSTLKKDFFVNSGFKVYEQKNCIRDDIEIGNSYVPKKIYDELERFSVKANDLLMSCSGTIGKVVVVPKKYEIGIINQALLIMRLNNELLDSKFFLYSFRSEDIQNQIKDNTQGGVMQNLVATDIFKSISFAIPSIIEQKKIASFLDHETAKIDTLITKQGKLIELLKEKRQAVISHAVTKGLNPNAPMKDSGVEWLGEVPGHWTVSLIKYQCKEITDGAHISPELENGEHLFVSIRDIKEGIINFEDALLTSEKSYQYLVHTGCMPFEGDILFSKDGTIGQTAITPPNVDFVVASSLIIIRPKFSKVIPEFLDLLLRSDVVQEQVESFVKGAALRRLSIQNLLKIWGIFPPLAEQKELVDFVQLQLEKYKILEVKAEQQVELLRERRTALISAAVTGKIDVCNWQHPNQKNNNNTELSA